jgi:hypothetical protein
MESFKMKQPDFSHLFTKLFRSEPRRIKYEARQDSNLFHDMVFLDSLIHDARIQCNQLKQRGTKLTIPLERDCWELPVKKDSIGVELFTAKATLSISPVLGILWTCNQLNGLKENEILWINGISLNRKDFDQYDFLIYGKYWSLHLNIGCENTRICLQDIELPHLYS